MRKLLWVELGHEQGGTESAEHFLGRPWSMSRAGHGEMRSIMSVVRSGARQGLRASTLKVVPCLQDLREQKGGVRNPPAAPLWGLNVPTHNFNLAVENYHSSLQARLFAPTGSLGLGCRLSLSCGGINSTCWRTTPRDRFHRLVANCTLLSSLNQSANQHTLPRLVFCRLTPVQQIPSSIHHKP